MMISRARLSGLGTVDCPPPNITSVALPAAAFTGGPGTAAPNYSYQLNCSSATTQAQITNQNLYEEWQNDLNNANLNGQPPPPCPAYQQPNCAAIQQSLDASLASGTAVDSSGWSSLIQPAQTSVLPTAGYQTGTSAIKGSPIGVPQPGGTRPGTSVLTAGTPIVTATDNTPQPSSTSTSGGIVPASAITPPATVNTAAPATSVVGAACTDSIGCLSLGGMQIPETPLLLIAGLFVAFMVFKK